MKNYKRVPVCIAALLAVGAIQQTFAADDTVFSLPPVTVTDQTEPYIPSGVAVRPGSRIATKPIDSSRNIVTLSNKVMTDQKPLVMQDIMFNVSGVAANSNLAGNRSNYMLRGYNIDDNNGTKIDGQQTLQWADYELFNVERVEVSKGPNASAYGKSDPGGFVNIVTKKADWSRAFEFQQDVGTDSYLKTSFMANLPINDVLASRTVLTYSTQDAAHLNGDAKKDRNFFSQNFMFNIGPKTSLELDFRHLYDTQNYGLTSQLPAVGKGPAPINIRTNMSSPGDDFTVDDYSVGYRFKTELSEGITFNHSLKYQTVDRTRKYLNPSSLSNAGVLSTKYYWNESTKTYTSTDNFVAIDSTVWGMKNSLAVGFDWVNADSDSTDYSAASSQKYNINIYNPNFTGFTWKTGPAVDSSSNQRTTGLYFQDQLSITDRLIVSAGLRHDSSTQSGGGTLTSTDVKNSPNVGLVYKITPTLSVFADYATSFMPQSQLVAGYVPPQTSKSKEVGMKWIDASKDFSITGSYYELVKNDIATVDPTNPSLNVYTGQAKNTGFEVDASVRLSKAWSVMANYANVDSKITKDNVATNVGNRFPSVPRESYGAWVMYEQPKYGMGLGFTHMSSRAGDTANTFELPAYTVVNASAFYKLTPTTRLQLTVRNLFDKEYYAGSNSRYNIMQGQPFSATASVNVVF